jgi:hypothetical protein
VLTVVVHFFLLRVCLNFVDLFFDGALLLSKFELSLVLTVFGALGKVSEALEREEIGG